MSRATSYFRAGTAPGIAVDRAVLPHHERHFRRRLIKLENGDDILVDLPAAIAFETGDMLICEDGRLIEIIAADEDLLEITAANRQALLELAWHLGNRHLPAQLDPERILIADDHVIRDMLHGLGANVTAIRAPFLPARGAYHAHDHSHDHA